jgi:ribosomal protein S18 acetylase RimI-like enzyme
VHLNETRAEAARRKLFEECQLTAATVHEVGTYDVILKTDDDHVRHGITTLFRMKVTDGEVRIDPTSQSAEWRRPDEWLSTDIDEFVADQIRLGSPATPNPPIEKLTASAPKELFDQMARLHMQEIHHGLLPLMGVRFLARLYFDLCRAPGSGVWAAIEQNRVVGFLAGSIDLGAAYRYVMLRSGLILAGLSLGSLFKGSVLQKLPSLFAYPFRVRRGNEREQQSADEDNSHAELLAIAVDRGHHGKGIGKRLVMQFEEYLAQWKELDYYLVTTNCADSNSNEFYRAMQFQPCGTLKHHNLLLQRYRKKIKSPQK